MNTSGENGEPQGLLSIKDAVRRAVLDSSIRLTPKDLQIKLLLQFPSRRREIKSALRDLISAGDLAYTYHLGCSFVERSFNRPALISERIVLHATGCRHAADPGKVFVRIQPGASFGAGEHPTTRLALRGIDHVFSGADFQKPCERRRVLDIGTGTGVLAITAVLLGAESALAIDIDPCARAEARDNVRLNELGDRITVCERPVTDVTQRFHLVLANLRLPTLIKIHSKILEMVTADGWVVISGIKTDEKQAFLETFSEPDFKPVWSESEKDWTGMVLKRVASAD